LSEGGVTSQGRDTQATRRVKDKRGDHEQKKRGEDCGKGRESSQQKGGGRHRIAD